MSNSECTEIESSSLNECPSNVCFSDTASDRNNERKLISTASTSLMFVTDGSQVSYVPLLNIEIKA